MRLLIWSLLLIGIICCSQADAFWQSRDSNYNLVINGGCSQYTSLAARMDGGQDTVNVPNLICGLVTDGNWSSIVAFFMFAVNSTANANLNWVANANNLTKTGTVTLAANQGYTGDGTTGFFTPGTSPTAIYQTSPWAQNSATIGGCVVSSRTTGQNWMLAGSTNGSSLNSYFEAHTATSVFFTHMNDNTSLSAATTSAQGAWYMTRTGASTEALYLNGNTTPFATSTAASTGAPTQNPYVLALNSNGTAAQFNGDQVAYVFFASGLTSMQVNSIYNRLHTYLQAVGETTAC